MAPRPGNRDEDDLDEVERPDPEIVEGEEAGEVVKLDDKPAKTDREEDDDQEDERLDLGQQDMTDDEREEVRNRRRNRRQKRRQAAERDRQEIEGLRAQVEALTQRHAHLEAGASRATLMSLGQQRQRLVDYIGEAEMVHAEALRRQDSSAVLKAQEAIQEAKRRVNLLDRHLAAGDRAFSGRDDGRESSVRQAPRQQVHPRVQAFANDFQKNNSWYDPASPNPSPETLVTLAIDAAIMKEGYDPTSRDYWDELDRRVKLALPQVADDDDGDDDEPRRPVNGRPNGHRRGPPVGGGSSGRALKPGEVYVSPERKRAMQEAGYWDDEKLRKDVLKRYAEADRRSSSRSARN